MLITAIKNNLKLILRNKIIIICLIIAPVGVLALLGSVFDDMMGTYTANNKMSVGYMIEGDSIYTNAMEAFSMQNTINQLSITKFQIEKEQIEDTVRNNDLAAFVLFTGKDYTFYESSKHKIESGIIKQVINRIVEVTSTEIADKQMQTSQQSTYEYSELETINVTPLASAKDYYGIIEIVYFAMCGIVTISVVVNSERKNHIIKRMQIAGISRTKLYLSKLIPCFVGVFLQSVVAIGLSTIIVGNKWGRPIVSLLILALLTIAASALGILALQLFKNMAVSIVVTFSLVWIMGFYGGSFQNYMMNAVPDLARKLSPIYYVNRTLVELRTMGESAYTKPCILILLGMIALCSVLAVILMKRGMEE